MQDLTPTLTPTQVFHDPKISRLPDLANSVSLSNAMRDALVEELKGLN